MKLINKVYGLAFLATVGIAFSCKDDSIELIPKWESGVHAQARITSSNTDFLYNNPAAPVNFDLQWISIDGQVKITKIDLFVLFNENYIDKDGNPSVARHGGAGGRLFKTIDGSNVPASRTYFSNSISQADLYTLYQDAMFDYDGTGPNPAISVFDNPAKPQRDASHRFMWDDRMSIRWEFTAEDGRVFEKWGVSVCTEFPDSDCSVDFTVVCATSIEKPEGTWTFNMVDTYGDGWQGGFISVRIDGVEVDKISIPNGGGGSGSDTFVYPGTGQLSFAWSLDTWNSECQFTIVSPSGNTVANVKTPPAGTIKLDLCLE